MEASLLRSLLTPTWDIPVGVSCRNYPLSSQAHCVTAGCEPEPFFLQTPPDGAGQFRGGFGEAASGEDCGWGTGVRAVDLSRVPSAFTLLRVAPGHAQCAPARAGTEDYLPFEHRKLCAGQSRHCCGAWLVFLS